MAWVAWDSDTPGAKLKLKVSDGTPPSCDTDKAVLVSSMRAKLVKGTAWPRSLMNCIRFKASAFCKYGGASSITTRYWFNGL